MISVLSIHWNTSNANTVNNGDNGHYTVVEIY